MSEGLVIPQALTTKPTTILLNAPNNAGKTPLHLACEADKPDCVTVNYNISIFLIYTYSFIYS